MKKAHLLGIAVIAIAIGILMTTATDASTYVTFREAYELASEGAGKQVHVVGKLKRDGAGQITGMNYQPMVDANRFTFVLVDNNNQEQKVVFSNPKPQDFEKSEQVVVVGEIRNEEFVASKILMKCPSKYQENKLEEKEYSASAKL